MGFRIDAIMREDDARLIAAAPDMLAELHRLHKICGHQATADMIAKASGREPK